MAATKTNSTKKEAKIEQAAAALRTTQNHLNALHDACNSEVELQSCSLNKKNFELTASCDQAEQATDCMQKLRSNADFQNVKLASLQQSEEDHSVLFTIRGRLRKE